jgi:uncharacterized protein DUF4760
MAAPTRDDAFLLVQIAQLSAMSGVDDALPELLSHQFDPETADAARNPAVRKVLVHFEMIATFTKNGVLSEDLVNDTYSMAAVWRRVGPAALRQRETVGEPGLFANFEALATGSD